MAIGVLIAPGIGETVLPQGPGGEGCIPEVLPGTDIAEQGIRPQRASRQGALLAGSELALPSTALSQAARIRVFSRHFQPEQRDEIADVLRRTDRQNRRALLGRFYADQQAVLREVDRRRAAPLNVTEGARDEDRYRMSGYDFSRTRPAEYSGTGNRFVDLACSNVHKTREDYAKDLDRRVESHHHELLLRDGFLRRGVDATVDRLYAVFERLIPAYNELAPNFHAGPFRGKLFLVDSAEVNAFVFAEHEDVYVHAGLLRDYARFCERRGIPVTEEAIACIYAHELGHVLQHTGEHGLDFSGMRNNRSTAADLLELRRNAENDADLVLLAILERAGYSPRELANVLDFLDTITPHSTAENAESDHPHPKERKSSHERELSDDTLVTTTWGNPLTEIPADAVVNLVSERHRGANANTLAGGTELLRAVTEARSPSILVELGAELAEEVRYTAVRAVADSEAVRESFARHVLLGNLLRLGEALIAEAHRTAPPDPVSPGANLGSRVERCRDGQFAGHPAVTELIRRLQHEVEREASETVDRGFRCGFERLIEAVETSQLPMRERERLVTQLAELVAFWKEAHGDAARIFDVTRPADRSFRDLAQAYAGGERDVLPYLRTVALAVYERFGRRSLGTHQVNLSGDLPIPGTQMGLPLTTLRATFVREHSDLYFEHSALLPIDSPDARARVFQLARNEWVAGMVGRHYAVVQNLPGFRDALIRTLPDLPFGKGGEGYSAQNRRLKILTAQYFDKLLDLNPEGGLKDRAGRIPDELQEVVSYLYVVRVLPAAERIRSSVLEHEYQLTALKGPQPFLRVDRQHRELLELFQESDRAARLLIERLNDLDSSPAFKGLDSRAAQAAVRRLFRDELRHYSRTFKEQVLRAFIGDSGSTLQLTAQEFFTIARGEIGFTAAYDFVPRFIANSRWLGSDAPLQTVQSELSFCEWYLRRRGEDSAPLGPSFGGYYLRLAVESLRRSSVELTPEAVFPFIERIAEVCLLSIHTNRPSSEPGSPVAGRGFNKGRDTVTDLDVPIAFFHGPRYDSLAAEWDQGFFRQFMGFTAEQLTRIATLQRSLLEYDARGTNRQLASTVLERGAGHHFIHLLDVLLVQRAREKLDPACPPVTPERFSGLLSVDYYPPYGMGGWACLSINIKWSTVSSSGQGRDPLRFDDQQARRLLREITPGFIPFRTSEDHRYTSDALFSEVLENEQRTALFDDLMPLLCEPPIVNTDTARERLGHRYATRISYLEAASSVTAAKGLKAESVIAACACRPELLVCGADERWSDHVHWLAATLRSPTYFRDGFLDHWERQLVPEVHRHSGLGAGILPLDSLESTNRHFQRSLIEGPLEWNNLENLRPESFSAERRRTLLDFYTAAIPLICDTQRKTRFGCTALEVWEADNPAATFEEQCRAVERFLPDPSIIRDEALHAVVDGATVGGRGVPEEALFSVRNLFTRYQSLKFDRELTSKDAAISAVRSICSSAGPEDRLQLLLWILDDKANRQPNLFQEIDRSTNIDFSLLPQHARFAPRSVRQTLLNDLLLGENGLLTANSPEGLRVRERLAGAIFDHYFPASGNDPRKTGLSGEHLAVIRDIFTVVLCSYRPGRAASIIQSLVDLEFSGSKAGLLDISFGKRLATVMCSIGPAGKKVCQTLSEKPEIVKSAALRRDFATAKNDAGRFHKMGAVDSLLTAGWKLADHELGPAVASASMGQAHVGAVRQADDSWTPAMHKVLRPDIDRSIAEDEVVLHTVAAMLLSKHRIDIGAFPATVCRVLRKEGDLRDEAANLETFGASVAADSAATGVPVRVPQLLSPPAKSIIAMELVRGVTLDDLGSPRARRRILEQRLAAMGVAPEECRRILSRSWSTVRGELRRVFLNGVLAGGSFHGDLHGKNGMADADSLWLIDVGLIGSLTPDQRGQIQMIAKGIFLRKPHLVAAGVEQFLGVDGGAGERRQRFADIRKALEHPSLALMLQDLGLMALRQRSAPEVQDTLSTFFKGFCNATWLFPTDVLNAPATFRDVAQALGLTPQERRKALSVNLVPVARSTASAVAEWGISTILDPSITAAGDLNRRIRHALAGRRLLKNTLSQAEDTIDFGLNLQEFLVPDTHRSTGEIRVASTYEGTLQIAEDGLREYLSSHPSLDEERLRQGIQAFAAYSALLRGVGWRKCPLSLHLSQREYFHLGRFGPDLVATVLAAEFMRRQYPHDPAVGRLFNRSTPQAQALFQSCMHVCRTALELRDELTPPGEKGVSDAEWIFSPSTVKEFTHFGRFGFSVELMVQTVPDQMLTRSLHEGEDLPEWARAPEVRAALHGLSLHQIGQWSISELKTSGGGRGVVVSGRRLQHLEAGLLELHLDAPQAGSVIFQCTDREFSDFLRKGRVSRFESVTYGPAEAALV